MNFIQPHALTQVDQMQSLVEHRSRFSMDFCELNLFETRQRAADFHLQFGGFTITSMLRGKKVMHLPDMDDFDYVPGETVVAPSETLMRIDFPEAALENPTQCTALVIDDSYLNEMLAYINSRNQDQRIAKEWSLNLDDLLLKNNQSLSRVSTRLLQTFTSNDPLKDYQADLLLRELVLCLLRLQNLTGVTQDATRNKNRTAFHAVLNYIHQNISSEIKIEELCKVACMSKSSLYRAFADEYGVSPLQLILDQRLRHAKDILQNNPGVCMKEVAFSAGFNDPNYFSRAFRKAEGISPTAFRQQLLA